LAIGYQAGKVSCFAVRGLRKRIGILTSINVLLHRRDELGFAGIFLPRRREQPLETGISLVLIVEID
jgi:hypothetical protein